MGTEPVGGRWYQGDQAPLPENEPTGRDPVVQRVITALLGLVAAACWYAVFLMAHP